MRRLLCFMLVMFFAGAGRAEDACYHLSGTIGEKLEIRMDLVRFDREISGSYYYARKGAPIALTGELAENGELTLREAATRYMDPTAEFRGSFSAGVFTGTWRSLTAEKPPLPARLAETTAVRFLPYALADTTWLLSPGENTEDESPVASVDYVYLDPAAGQPGAKALQALVRGFYQGDTLPSLAPPGLLGAMRDDYFRRYREMREDYDSTAPAHAWSWNIEQRLEIIMNEPEALVLERGFYEYTGGAHGGYGSSFLVIDPRTFRVLGLDDIFSGNCRALLPSVIKSSLKAQLGEDYDPGMFFVDPIPVTDNFYLTREGVVFYYGIYEIGPYAMGEQRALLRYQDIRQWLKPGSAAERLAQQRLAARSGK